MAKGPQRDGSKEAGWRLLIAEQASSRLSVRAFCLQRGVSEASFYAWKRKLTRRDDEVSEASPRFVEVVVGDGVASADKLSSSTPRQVYVADVRIEVLPGFDAGTLKAAVEVLRGPAC